MQYRKEQTDQCKWIESRKIDPHKESELSFTKFQKQLNGERMFFKQIVLEQLNDLGQKIY